MKITNRKIVNNTNLLAALTNKQLPIKISYAIAKNISKIEKELEIYNIERQKIIDKYCIKDSKGNNAIDDNNQYKIDDKYLESFNKDINELLDIEIDINMHKINKDDLFDSNCNMTPAELMLIDYMIEE